MILVVAKIKIWFTLRFCLLVNIFEIVSQQNFGSDIVCLNVLLPSLLVEFLGVLGWRQEINLVHGSLWAAVSKL